MSVVPPNGALAAHVLLDAVVSQSAEATPEDNVAVLELALARLVPDADNRDLEIPDAGDTVAASIVCLSWSMARLAASQGKPLEEVVSELREFIDSLR
ncbi:hypothetical protein N1031_08635 [Herbiconiux moechotypicola]|uniref:DUF1844 domain-containing protein n=1 Tax=Herbiconiux moechotypicola TaxID=637393 RepID=A0ABP5QGQ7_9MICO|nr:hypothetical protein [Herbiconiux moechotypicola]MCS5729825.1 hypothetical protein [Herbiconiux moechotypicola]